MSDLVFFWNFVFFILSYRPLFEFGIQSDTQHIRRPDFHEFSRRMFHVRLKLKQI